MKQTRLLLLAAALALSLTACGGSASLISRIVYTLVGLSAVWCVSLLFRLGDGK